MKHKYAMQVIGLQSNVTRKLLVTLLIFGSILAGKYEVALAETNMPINKGNLVFTQAEKEIVFGLGESSQEVTFEFTNKSTKPIRIVGIKSSCGCTVPELAKKEYEPGESGSMNVTFKASAGVQNTSGAILLVSDEPEDNFYNLRLVVNRKQVALLSSQKEEWKVGSTPDEREILVDVSEAGTHIIEASTNNDVFDVKMTTVDPGKQYKVTVKPRISDYPAAATLRLQTTHQKQPFLTARLEIK